MASPNAQTLDANALLARWESLYGDATKRARRIVGPGTIDNREEWAGIKRGLGICIEDLRRQMKPAAALSDCAESLENALQSESRKA